MHVVFSHRNSWFDEIHVCHRLYVSECECEWVWPVCVCGKMESMFSPIDQFRFIIIFPVMELRSRISFASKGEIHRRRATPAPAFLGIKMLKTVAPAHFYQRNKNGRVLRWRVKKKHYSVIQSVFASCYYIIRCAPSFLRAVSRDVVSVFAQ